MATLREGAAHSAHTPGFNGLPPAMIDTGHLKAMKKATLRSPFLIARTACSTPAARLARWFLPRARWG